MNLRPIPYQGTALPLSYPGKNCLKLLMILLQLLYRLLLSVYYNTVLISCQLLSFFVPSNLVEAAFLSYVCIIALNPFIVNLLN